jgi:hypothetical protein
MTSTSNAIGRVFGSSVIAAGETYHDCLSPECHIAAQRVGGRPPISGAQNELRKSAGGAVAGWLRTTYRAVFQENPMPAFAFMACFLGIMFGILFLMT